MRSVHHAAGGLEDPLQHLGAQDIIRARHVEPVLLVELQLRGRRRGAVREVPVRGYVREGLGADARRRARVRVPARVDEFEGEVDDGAVVEEAPAEEPVPAVEAFEVRPDVEELAFRVVAEVLEVADDGGLMK